MHEHMRPVFLLLMSNWFFSQVSNITEQLGNRVSRQVCSNAKLIKRVLPTTKKFLRKPLDRKTIATPSDHDLCSLRFKWRFQTLLMTAKDISV